MARSAKSRKRKQSPGLLVAGLSATGRAIAERPVGVGGVTAFAITFAFVAANAIWYQPHQHKSAFFQTRHLPPREPAEPVDVTRLELAPELDLPEEVAQPTPMARPQEMPQPAAGTTPATPMGSTPDARQAVVAEVQRVLAELDLYTGAIDGLTGPQTDQAVQIYRQKLGLAADGGIDGELLRHLGARTEVDGEAQAIEQAARAAADQMQTASAPSGSDQRVLRIQAGLRAFGNQGIDLDGRVGPRTVAAIKEFQSLFGLAETGEPDDATYAKMKEIGLTD
ncbi:peptidoglycan-binding protein [Aliihoeflea sp. 40Bstr573]|uniref:peptidoglycan-binding domain-containing protein n=1 Tax=Aliihoeflea sp. 40Bstr573 TaxID=2696467 RepID=UPI0020940DBF|nr:peptidoglycan-binding protein [Aliihoeflea sp. 40Bstr573]MCO6386009.1 peptidoglycan-binding protein [Aliihoeflea sp. 40Bstr573]